MSRLHSATYTIPLHRPWWSTLWRATQLAWLRHRRQCVIDERDGYVERGMRLGPQYLNNCADAIARYDAAIALLQVNS